MNTKMLISILLFSLYAGLTNCKKQCPSNAACYDTVPTNESCLAHFSRWFYNKKNNKCEFVNYSGCSEKGFATQKECEECLK